MNRTWILAIFALLLLGLWSRPLRIGAGEPTTTAPVSVALTSVTTHPTTLPATTQSSRYRVLRGQAGFWRVAQTPDGVWWFLSPRDATEFLNAVTTVQPFQVGRDKDGPDYVSGNYGSNREQSGDLDLWAKTTLDRVTSTGFKSLGAWSNPVFHKFNIPMSRDLNLSTWMRGANLKFYSREWPAMAERAIRSQVEPLKDNHNLVGYYIDNELDWTDGGIGPALHFDGLNVDDPNRQEVVRVIRTTWPTLEGFNADWKVHLRDWKDLDTWKSLPHDQQHIYGRLFAAWSSHLASDYFRLSCNLVRKYDPNHLILGVRFKAYAPPEIVRASRGWTDAQSINVYPGDARLDADIFRSMCELSDQPVIISEYSFHSLDGRSGDRNTVGFSAQVLDQRARADAYRLFTTRAARVPGIIGADWFQWMDEPPSGRSSDGEDVNFGIVDVDDRPYDLLVTAIRETTPLLNPAHENSAHDDGKDVWRESFANKPVMHVPFLPKPPVLNGELSDWPAACKLPGINHSQTVGLERSPLPLPNLYLGWNNDGLYLGMEVFDNDIQAAPPSGWWWTRDHVELWLSTRPVASDQEEYNEFCHEFFFVPLDVPFEGHYVGSMGQWHRPGDALKDNILSHPDIHQAVRIFPDRYVVEALIPNKALHGFDPKTQPALAFNIYIRNYQHAIDYFWSAPKEVMTQLHPNTWGSLYLEAPKSAVTAAQ